MGKTFERWPDTEKLFQECKYGDSKDRQRVRTFSLKFGALDEIWFKDRQGHELYLRVNSKISEDQAVALAKAAMD